MTAVDPELPLHDVRTFDEVVATHVEERRLAMATMLAFGSLGLLLAVAGLYAVLAYLVHLRSREIGIRMAIGAASAMVRRDVLASGLGHALVGCVLGGAASLAIWRVVAATVPGVGLLGLRSLAAVACVIVGLALVATWIPAARATRVDPVSVLRAE